MVHAPGGTRTGLAPHTSYLVCTTPRSGSAFLCDALAGTGVAGYPDEYFNRLHERGWAGQWGVADASYADYLEASLAHRTTPNGVFGAKLMWWQLQRLASRLQCTPQYSGLPAAEVLHSALPQLHYIWLTRRDTVAQAVSHWKAAQTGMWHVAEGAAPAAVREPVYDFEAIDSLVREIESQDVSWQHYFTQNCIQPLHVVYEEVVEAYRESMHEILGFLEIPTAAVNVVKPPMARQADATSEEWIRSYRGSV